MPLRDATTICKRRSRRTRPNEKHRKVWHRPGHNSDVMRRVLTKNLLTCSLASASFLFLSCGGRQSAVDAAGIQAERLEDLWWIFFWVCTAVYVIVMAVLLTAFFRSKRADSQSAPDTVPNETRED